jgi:DNA-binding MarR family transcriptional regulator
VLSQPGLTPKQIILELKLEKSTVTRFIDVLGKKRFAQQNKASAETPESQLFIQPINQ